MSDIIMFTRPIIPPPPRPWITRDARSIFMFRLAPHNALPNSKSPIDTKRMGFRPQMSDALP